MRLVGFLVTSQVEAVARTLFVGGIGMVVVKSVYYNNERCETHCGASTRWVVSLVQDPIG